MKLDITPVVPLLPEGWEGSPDDLLQWWKENVTFELDGAFPSGQIGGTKPVEDAGVFYGDNAIEKFRDGAYRPITDVPIGACLPWASVNPAAPEFFLLCNGQSVLRADYPFLFNVIGTTWGVPVGPTVFYIPDMRGRVIYGAGQGDYVDQGITGKLQDRVTGTKVGTSWLRRVDLYLSSPTPSMKKVLSPYIDTAANQWDDTTQPGLVMQWIIRYK